MAINYNPSVVSSGLVLALDAANPKSYDKYENLITYSRVANTNWVAINSATVTENSATSPDGTNNATQIAGAAIAASGVYRTFPLTSGISYTYSLFVKAVSGTNTIYFGSDGGTVALITINTSTGVASTNAGSPTNITSVPYPNGWYRISFTFTPSSTTTHSLVIYNLTASTNTWLVYGVQVEKGSSANDYYETTTTAKTRGTTWTDLSGNGNTGTINGSPTFTNGYFSITSDSTYISIPNSGLVPRTNDFTYSCWIYFNSVDGADTIFENGSWTDTLLFRYESTQFTVYAEGALVGTISWTAITGSWVNIILRRQSNTVSCYINNVLTGTPFTMSTDINLANPNLWLMRSQHTINQFTSGRISIFSIYNRALTPQEIQQNYNALKGRFSV